MSWVGTVARVVVCLPFNRPAALSAQIRQRVDAAR